MSDEESSGEGLLEEVKSDWNPFNNKESLALFIPGAALEACSRLLEDDIWKQYVNGLELGFGVHADEALHGTTWAGGSMLLYRGVDKLPGYAAELGVEKASYLDSDSFRKKAGAAAAVSLALGFGKEEYLDTVFDNIDFYGDLAGITYSTARLYMQEKGVSATSYLREAAKGEAEWEEVEEGLKGDD